MSQDPQAKFQQLYLEQQMLESRIKALQQNIELVQVSLNSYRSGLSVLEELEGKKAGEEVLLNVGGAIFLEATLVRPEKVTRGIGSGIRIEQSQKVAKDQLTKTVETLESRLEDLQNDYENSINRAQIINATLQQIAADMQSQQPATEQESSSEE